MRSVLVTGASSGIGEATAKILAAAGWRVFAGVRRLGSEPFAPGIEGLQMDVGDADSIQRAAAELTSRLGEQHLDAVVNNAGMGQIAPMEHVSPAELQKIFSVNVFGLVAVTQAVLPLLRKSRGRIVNLSSVGGLITIPFGGGLCATKHAVEAISEAFRLELLPAGIRVIAIRPASIASPAAGKLVSESDAFIASLTETAREHYEKSLREFVKRMEEQESAGSPPEVVGDVILKALQAENPATHYLVGKDSTVINFLAHWVPENLRDHLLLKKLGLPTEEQSPS